MCSCDNLMMFVLDSSLVVIVNLFWPWQRRAYYYVEEVNDGLIVATLLSLFLSWYVPLIGEDKTIDTDWAMNGDSKGHSTMTARLSEQGPILDYRRHLFDRTSWMAIRDRRDWRRCSNHQLSCYGTIVLEWRAHHRDRVSFAIALPDGTMEIVHHHHPCNGPLTCHRPDRDWALLLDWTRPRLCVQRSGRESCSLYRSVSIIGDAVRRPGEQRRRVDLEGTIHQGEQARQNLRQSLGSHRQSLPPQIDQA